MAGLTETYNMDMEDQGIFVFMIHGITSRCGSSYEEEFVSHFGMGFP